MCDEPAEGKRKGRPKAEVQELRSIPVSISMNRGGGVKLAFFFFFLLLAAPSEYGVYIQYGIAIIFACIELSLPRP